METDVMCFVRPVYKRANMTFRPNIYLENSPEIKIGNYTIQAVNRKEENELILVVKCV